MINLLDCFLIWSDVQDTDTDIRLEARLYDGDMYVASKVWVSDDELVLYNTARVFWCYWNRLYFDTGGPIPLPPPTEHAQQLTLPFD